MYGYVEEPSRSSVTAYLPHTPSQKKAKALSSFFKYRLYLSTTPQPRDFNQADGCYRPHRHLASPTLSGLHPLPAVPYGTRTVAMQVYHYTPLRLLAKPDAIPVLQIYIHRSHSHGPGVYSALLPAAGRFLMK